MIRHIFSLLCTLSLFSSFGFSCVDFQLTSKDGAHIVGRSLEFGIKTAVDILVYPQGETIQSSAPNNQKGMSWTSKYGYVGLKGFGEALIGGFNEKGLSFNILWFPDAKYPSSLTGSSDKVLDYLIFGNWALGNFDSVDALKEALTTTQLYFHKFDALGETPPIHFILHDRKGKTITIEPIDGKIQIFDNPVGLMTNAPALPWHLTNLRNYINLNGYAVKPIEIDGFKIAPTGQGAGLLGLPGDSTPPSRFIKIAFYKYLLDTPLTAAAGINAAFHLLNSVDIPYGIVRGEKGDKGYDYTQWITVADTTNMKLYTRSYDQLNVDSYDFSNETFKQGTKPRKVGSITPPY